MEEKRQSLVSLKRPSFKDSVKKVSLASGGAIAYMKNGKIIKVDYPKEKESRKRLNGFDDNLNGGSKNSPVDKHIDGDVRSEVTGEETERLYSDLSSESLNSKGPLEKIPSIGCANQLMSSAEMNNDYINLINSSFDISGKTVDSDLEDDVFLPPISSRISMESRPFNLSIRHVHGLPSNRSNFGDVSPGSPTSLGFSARDHTGSPSSPTQLCTVLEDVEESMDNCDTNVEGHQINQELLIRGHQFVF
jgi:hypothetical protein